MIVPHFRSEICFLQRGSPKRAVSILRHLPCYVASQMRRLHTWVSFGVLACVAVVAASADAAPRAKKKKPAAAEPAKTAEETSDFDKQAAVSAIAAITDGSLQKCKATNAAKGEGHVMITFAPAGAAQTATIDKGPWVGTPVAKCMVKEFKKAKVPAFKGDSVTVGKSFHFE